MALLLVLAAAASAASVASAAQPNPPRWPASVAVFGPEDPASQIQSVVDAAYDKNGGQNENGQFSPERFAFLFKPGSYSVDVPVGYYTQVLGLGRTPTDVVFTSSKGVFCEEASYSHSIGALDTFWRGAENFQTNANFSWNHDGHKGMLWAASQAAALRRLVVANDLDLFQYRSGDRAAGYASGGYMANTLVKGLVASGSQQQFMARNCEVSEWQDGVWNIVTVGVKGANPSHCGADSKLCTHGYTNVAETPVAIEKPFISIDSSGKFFLNAPGALKDYKGVEHGTTNLHSYDFSEVFVAEANVDTAASINEKLSAGLHVVLSPGIYNLSVPLELNAKNQILLGLGLATLVAANGTAAVKVGNVPGVRVAGILVDAGPVKSPALVEWGSGSYAGDATNPGVMSDVFTRVGGPAMPSQAQVHAMVVINSGHVVVDNTWLWRADHAEGGRLIRNGENPCEVAAIINGDDVTAYGFKAEHCLTDQLQWNGDRGSTYMFQAEAPYDVSQANFGDMGYVGYRVASNVLQHAGYGVGVYHFFRDHAVTMESGISAPAHLESSFVAPLTVYLNGNGTIKHILNDKGAATSLDTANPTVAVPAWVCKTPSVLAPSNGTCKVGDPVQCPGSGSGCSGNSCCPDGTACPSAEEEFGCCPKPKAVDCVKPDPMAELGELEIFF